MEDASVLQDGAEKTAPNLYAALWPWAISDHPGKVRPANVILVGKE